MRSLSFWAKYHVVSARIIIIISHCVLIWIGYFLGTQLSKRGVVISPLWIYFLIAVFFITGAIYPRSRSTKRYVKRKFSDLILALCGFFLTVCIVNDLNNTISVFQSAKAVAIVDPSPYKFAEAKKLLEQFQKGEKTHFTAKEKRIIRDEFKYQLLQYGKAKIIGNKAQADEVALIILACIAAVGLLFLVAALACSLSCNGSDAAAVVVGVLGTAAVIFGLVAAIKAIKRKRNRAKQDASK